MCSVGAWVYTSLLTTAPGFPAQNKLKDALTRVNMTQDEVLVVVRTGEEKFSVLLLHGCMVPKTCRAP